MSCVPVYSTLGFESVILSILFDAERVFPRYWYARGSRQTKKGLITYFKCEDCSEMKQLFKNKFDIIDNKWSTPAASGSVLEKARKEEDSLSAKLQTYSQSGIGKMIHIMQWSRTEISHSMRNLAKMMGKGNDNSIKVMHRCIQHCVGTPTRGVTLRPQGNWDGTKDYKFVINSRSYSDYAKNPDTIKSMTGTRVLVNGASTKRCSAPQIHVPLSVTKAE